MTVQIETRRRRQDAPDGRPTLAVAHDVTSSSPLELAEALGVVEAMDRLRATVLVDA